MIKIETESGFFIAGDVFGDIKNTPVLLLHGGGQTRHSWGMTAQLLADAGYYAIALDARGHGDSDWSKTVDYSFEAMVSDIQAVIKTLSSPPIIVGASMGGLVAMLLAGERKVEKLKAIILVDIAPKPEQKGIERIFAFMSANMKDGFENINEAAEAVTKYLPHREKSNDNSRLEKNLRFRNGRYYWHWDPAMLGLWQSITPNQAIANENRMLEAAKSIKTPTLIIRGGFSDVVSEKVMTEFTDAVPNVKSVTVSGAGHMVAGDSNHAFSNAVIDFINAL